jgi:hypothetical protein
MKFLFPFLGVLMSLGSLSAADPLLSVDFNAGGRTPSATAAGFQPFDVTVAEVMGPIAVSYPVNDSFYSGPVTVTITTGKSEEDTGRMTARASKEASEATDGGAVALYGDNIISVDKKPLFITITGLRSGKKYNVDFFAFSKTASGHEQFTDITTGEPADMAEAEWNGEVEITNSTPLDQYQATLGVQADAKGKVLIKVTNKDSAPFLNGLRISEAR